MNYLGIDFGTKTIGLAYSISGIVSTLPSIPNNENMYTKILDISSQLNIDGIYVGLSVGPIATKTLKFVNHLRNMVKLPIDTVEEAVTTIEAKQIYHQNGRSQKQLLHQIDSVAAAVILSRVIS
jgi:putative transcription antitermination factor YqgF